jgi:ABC-2 type transport system permease protein
MRNVGTICRRELYSYFVSPIAWVLLALFAILSGFFTGVSCSYFVQDAMMSQMRGQAAPMSVNEIVIAPLLGTIALVSVFFVPFISMRLFAEEKRQGTMELLVTSPVKDLEIVIGKWLAAILM